MGLLQARETERIGAGAAGFLQIQTHAWFDGVDWEATLRREVESPWQPPRAADGAVEGVVDFSREDVRAYPLRRAPMLPRGSRATPPTVPALRYRLP